LRQANKVPEVTEKSPPQALHRQRALSPRWQSWQVVQPQLGQTGFPSVVGHRSRAKTFWAPRSDIRMTLPMLSDRAAADRRKC
jgi:hypothetical protein